VETIIDLGIMAVSQAQNPKTRSETCVQVPEQQPKEPWPGTVQLKVLKSTFSTSQMHSNPLAMHVSTGCSVVVVVVNVVFVVGVVVVVVVVSVSVVVVVVVVIVVEISVSVYSVSALVLGSRARRSKRVDKQRWTRSW
jgi:hypothetical protein